MPQLNRMEVLKKQELTRVKVTFPDSENKDDPEFVFVRQMTGRERDAFERSLSKEFTNAEGEIDYKRDISDFRAKLAVYTLCDEEGKNLLTAKDIELLSVNMSAFRLECIVEAAQKLNKITKEDREALVKNSGGDRKDDSISDSPKS